MAKNTKMKLPVMISDCTDPYQPLERDYKITRKCIETLTKYNFPILIVTKSDLVVRDIPFFKQASTVVSMSITTLNRDVTSFIEPCAPPPERRVSALQRLVEKGFTTIVRIDPLIPTLNDDEKNLERLVKVLADIGIKQVTTATMKPVKGFFQYLRSLDLKLHDQLFRIYSQGEYIMGYKYLKKDLRWKIMQKIHSIVRKYGIEFACCREGFYQLNTTLCDGTKYCRESLEKYMQ
jgi:DNA repair photolyase